MGGYGTWRLVAAYPERFAAAVPICGGGEPEKMAEPLSRVPIWAFHGAKDPIVPLVKESQQMVDAVRETGGDVKLTVYPDVRAQLLGRHVRQPGSLRLAALAPAQGPVGAASRAALAESRAVGVRETLRTRAVLYRDVIRHARPIVGAERRHRQAASCCTDCTPGYRPRRSARRPASVTSLLDTSI